MVICEVCVKDPWQREGIEAFSTSTESPRNPKFLAEPSWEVKGEQSQAEIFDPAEGILQQDFPTDSKSSPGGSGCTGNQEGGAAPSGERSQIGEMGAR